MSDDYHLDPDLPLSSQNVFLHPLFGKLLGLHVGGVLFEPGVLETLIAAQTSSADKHTHTGYMCHRGNYTLRKINWWNCKKKMYDLWQNWTLLLYLRENRCMMQDGSVKSDIQNDSRTRQHLVFQVFSEWKLWHCEGTHFMSFFSRLLIKSLASSEISSNASSSKSHVAEVTLDSVSISLSPMKGDKPLTLKRTRNN